jgi:hypothetical protein
MIKMGIRNVQTIPPNSRKPCPPARERCLGIMRQAIALNGSSFNTQPKGLQ